jgi:membrane associated rhomboid family serine protease
MQSIWSDIKLIFQQPNRGLLQLIVINVGVYIALMLTKVTLILTGKSDFFEGFLEQLSLSSTFAEFSQKPWTFLTYFWVHVDLMHVVFNMLFLYWFGQILQDFLGQTKTIQLYFVGGLAGAVTYIVVLNSIPFFINQGPMYLMGASAGVYAIVTSAATLRPNYTVHLFLIGPVAIKYISGFYVIWSILESVGSNGGGNIAHLGGALAGVFFAVYTKRVQKPSQRMEKIMSYVTVAAQKTVSLSTSEIVEEEELNQILDKISKSGFDSLSKLEKKRLFQASQKNE